MGRLDECIHKKMFHVKLMFIVSHCNYIGIRVIGVFPNFIQQRVLAAHSFIKHFKTMIAAYLYRSIDLNNHLYQEELLTVSTTAVRLPYLYF
jgi:hypothetical protein